MKLKELFGKTSALSQALKGSAALRGALITLATFVVIVGGFMAYAAAYSNIFPNVYVEDVKIGGMSSEKALIVLEENFTELAGDRTLTVKCVDSEKDVTLSELGVQLDHAATVTDALAVGKDGNIFSKSASLLKSFFNKRKINLAVSANSDTVTALVNELSAPYIEEVKDAGFRLDGSTLVIEKSKPGKVVNMEKAMNTFLDAAADSSVSVIELVPEDTEPKPVDTDKFYEALTAAPRDAYYKHENGEVIVVEEVPSVIVAKEEIVKAFENEAAEVRIPIKLDMPKTTASELRSMLFRDVLATYSSNFSSSSAARAQNVTLAASRVNGYILMPGDVFSYDAAIGRRTAANGYREAGVYVGNKVESGIGGGICQTSSTLYAAALYANLEIVTRTSHSLPVSYMPDGMDATIAEGYIDLKLRNNTNYPVKLVAEVSGRNLTCKILGVSTPGQTVEVVNTRTGTLSPKTVRTHDASIPVGYKKVISKGSTGYTVASKRIVKMNGEVVKTEKLTNSTYKARDIEEQINPADENTPSSSLAVFDPKNPPEVTTDPNTSIVPPSEIQDPSVPTTTPSLPDTSTIPPATEGSSEPSVVPETTPAEPAASAEPSVPAESAPIISTDSPM